VPPARSPDLLRFAALSQALEQGGNCPGSPRSKKASGRKAFFFEKKKQKTFVHFCFGLAGESETHFAKVFWFFFFKKELLTLSCGGGTVFVLEPLERARWPNSAPRALCLGGLPKRSPPYGRRL
jgi:hypothetical protein